MDAQTDLQLQAAIDLAIKAELEAEDFYAKAAVASADPRGRDMFQKLARFERHHYESLKRLRETFGEGSAAAYLGFSLLPEAPTAAASPLSDAQRQTDLDAIDTAISAERRAQAAYAELAARAVAPAVKRLFERLADEEALHEKVLQDQYLALANRGYWTWGE
jgi:rubrerythrin